MRPTMFLFLCSCTYGLATDRMVRNGFHSEPIYEDCMRKRGADPDAYDESPKDDRRCLDLAGEIYSGDRAAVGAVGNALEDAANMPGDGTVICKTSGDRTVCKD